MTNLHWISKSDNPLHRLLAWINQFTLYVTCSRRKLLSASRRKLLYIHYYSFKFYNCYIFIITTSSFTITMYAKVMMVMSCHWLQHQENTNRCPGACLKKSTKKMLMWHSLQEDKSVLALVKRAKKCSSKKMSCHWSRETTWQWLRVKKCPGICHKSKEMSCHYL